jgi:hypothetical protein
MQLLKLITIIFKLNTMINGNKPQALRQPFWKTRLLSFFNTTQHNTTQHKFNPIERVAALFERKNVLLFTLFSFVLLRGVALNAQAVNNQIKDVVMPSANAASLGKYGDIPVGYYTGIPSVGIPIHTVQEGAVSLPISLSYHAGGVKVGEPNSWVGLNWSLSAGGIISRTVQGKADESISGYFSIGKQIGITGDSCITRTINGTTSTGSSIPDAQFGSDMSKGIVDGEPDIFNFSIGGYSGKFYIDADDTNNGIVDGKVILIPKQDLRVQYSVSASTSVNRLYKFMITTPDGTKYEFGNNNDNTTDVANDAIEITKPFNTLCDRYASIGI